MDVYELLVYGIMLFPQIEHYVDLAAVDAFLGRQDWGEHPVVAVLANTYQTLDYCSKKNGRGLRCCTSLLFLWLTMHLFHSGKKTRCPIEDHYWSCIKPLMKLNGRQAWTKLWRSQSTGTHSGMKGRMGFPNIPLMGTQGAINYNHELHSGKLGILWSCPRRKRQLHPLLSTPGKRSSEKNLNRGCGAVGKSWLQHRIEYTFLTFSDPWFEVAKDELAGLRRPSKRKRKELDSWESEGNRGASPKAECWFRTVAQEKSLERALLEKEELVAALADARLKENDAKDHLHQLQEQITLLEADVTKGKLHNERLEKQRRQGLVELADERRKAADLGLRADTIV
ncbi:hypothetical protein CR513_15542, partial [Mucuna pruriens]